MFLLDTNVVSELRKAPAGRAAPAVVAWAARRPMTSFFLSVTTVLEIEIGVRQMERRDPSQGSRLRTWFEDGVLADFATRILVLDLAVARRCATLHVPNRRPEYDAIIAATALVHGLTVVTRNVVDFATTGVDVLNPWDLVP